MQEFLFSVINTPLAFLRDHPNFLSNVMNISMTFFIPMSLFSTAIITTFITHKLLLKFNNHSVLNSPIQILKQSSMYPKHPIYMSVLYLCTNIFIILLGTGTLNASIPHIALISSYVIILHVISLFAVVYYMWFVIFRVVSLFTKNKD